MNHVLERREVSGNGLIHEHIAVRQIEDALNQAGLEESPDDLEGGIGLSGTGCHHEKQTFLTGAERFEHGIDGLTLIVARLAPLRLAERLRLKGILHRSGMPGFADSRLQRRRRGKRLGRQCTLLPRQKIMLIEGGPVGGIGKGGSQHPGILHRLLNARRKRFGRALCLDNGHRGICRTRKQHIIGKKRFFANRLVAAQIDAAIRNFVFQPDSALRPLRLFQCRIDQLELGFRFIQSRGRRRTTPGRSGGTEELPGCIAHSKKTLLKIGCAAVYRTDCLKAQ